MPTQIRIPQQAVTSKNESGVLPLGVCPEQGSRRGALCIINNLGGLVINNGCGQLHVRELQVAMQRSKAKQISQRPAADFIW